MGTLKIKGLGVPLSSALCEAGKKRGLSVNKPVLESLATRFFTGNKKHRNDDLTQLTVTWFWEDFPAFNDGVNFLNRLLPGTGYGLYPAGY